jgi:hypothetical protein
MFLAQRRTSDPAVKVFAPATDLPSRLRRRIRHASIGRDLASYRTSRPATYGPFFDDRSPYGAECLAQLPPFGVLHSHTMLDLIDFGALFTTVPKVAPVIRTLHDMTFFTGGCHYAWSCAKYADRCGACQQLRSTREGDLSRQVWERKRAALDLIPEGRSMSSHRADGLPRRREAVRCFGMSRSMLSRMRSTLTYFVRGIAVLPVTCSEPCKGDAVLRRYKLGHVERAVRTFLSSRGRKRTRFDDVLRFRGM